MREAYPIEVSISFSAGLFHWLDSLAGLKGAGMSAGKTIEAHRQTFNRTFGRPDPRETELLQRFGEIRRRFVTDALAETSDNGSMPTAGPAELLTAFLDAHDLQTALGRARGLLSEDEHQELQEILDYFAPKYEKVWNDGRIPDRFLNQALNDKRLRHLESLLARIAEFFGVDPTPSAPPRLVLVPVRDGHGTHAQASDRYLLVELRARDRLQEVASVIVHENAHFLLQRMDADRLQRLEAAVWKRGETAVEAAGYMREALPTAMGQGVADRVFRPRLASTDLRWYSVPEVDRYAKRLYPLVRRALAGDRTFDEAFLLEALELYEP